MRNHRGGWWLTPGGGREPGETNAAALRRELEEEVGLTGVEPGPWVWRREHVYVGRTRVVRQREVFAVVRVRARFTPAPRASDPGTHELRWWPLPELSRCEDPLRPAALPWHLLALDERSEGLVEVGY